MRKNFLILMLMALLPLAGWAADLSKGTLIVPSTYYKQAPTKTTISVTNEAGTTLTVDNDFTFEGIYTSAACAAADKITEATAKAKDAGTVLYVKVSGTGDYENDLIASYEVKQLPLTLNGTPASKTYGEEDPETLYTIVKVTDALANDVTTTFDGKINITRTANENQGAYAFNGTITDATLAKNYTIASADIKDNESTPAQAKFTINKKTMSGNVTVADVADKVYNGSAQKPTVTITDNDLKTTVAASNYTLSYASNTTVGTATITITPKGNYQGSALTKNFSITAATLIVTPSASKVYDGNNNRPTTVVTTKPTDGSDYLLYSYQGIVDDKSVSDVTRSGETTSTDAPTAGTVGTYELTVVDASKHTLDNYKALANKGSFTITQKEVEIQADTKTLAYGEDEKFTVTLTASTFVSADEQAVKDATKVIKGEKNSKGEYPLTPAFKTEEEIDADADGAIAAVVNAAVDADSSIPDDDKPAAKAAGLAKAKAAAKAVLKNYKLKVKAGGKLTYTNAALQIALNESKYTLTKVYDGENITIATPASEEDLLIIGKQDGDVIDLSGLTVTITAKTATNNTKKNVDTYQIELSGAVAENYDITYIPSQYKITPRKLKVTAYDQTFVKGEVQSFNTTLYSIEEKEGEGLASTDTADEVFKLKTTVTFDETTGKVTSDAGTSDIDVVKSNDDDTKTKWGNYTVTVVKGTATVVATATLLDDSKSLVDLVATDADVTGAVNFSSRNLNAEKWNALVLPFDIAVKDLSDAFGYAVVDVLDQTASDGNMHFKFAVTGDIKANTPFLIYPTDKYNNLNQVSFTSVTIKKDALSKATVEVKDGSNNKLVGTYEKTSIYGEKFYAMFGGEWGRLGEYTETAPCEVKPLRAYIDLSASTSSAPVIYIEEPNGNTTAIKTLDVETMNAYSTDGWFNLNGVKLNGVPTEKGIYINNGKKVVIK